MKQVITTERIPIKLWLDDIEDGALEQAKNLANLPFAYKHIAIMPDSHQGYGMPIGGVLATQNVIIPNAVGVDIGCGMTAVKTDLTYITNEQIKSFVEGIRERVPVGFAHHQDDQEWEGFNRAPDIQIIQQELSSARKQLGTLGGGNHFIEIQQGNDDAIWVMIHSGSRNFGLKTANYFHKQAEVLCERWFSDIPTKELSFLPVETRDGSDYYSAMNYCLEFAEASRSRMMAAVLDVMDVMCANAEIYLDVHHNYAALENHFNKNVIVHRKGAISASDGEFGIIPGSMGTSSYIVVGNGNPESFKSCSHGAGRRMGRKEAERVLDLDAEREKMSGIVHGLQTKGDLDEAPGAYKPIDVVMENQSDLVSVLVELRPLGNIKG